VTEPRRISASVVIVGGGPVGLALAVTLGQAGVSCVLVERQREPSPIPRGQNLSARSLEHFYYWGCAGELRAARLMPAGFPIGGITAYQSLASEYWYAPAGRETVAGFFYHRNERLPQYLTERCCATGRPSFPRSRCCSAGRRTACGRTTARCG